MENALTQAMIESGAKAIERIACEPYGWTAEQFEIWWTSDPRNHDHEKRRAQARACLEAVERVT